MEFSLIPAQHYPLAVMDSPLNGNTSLQTSVSNLNASFSRPAEQEDEGKFSTDAIWLWVAIIATVCNIVVVAVIVRSLHIRTSGFTRADGVTLKKF